MGLWTKTFVIALALIFYLWNPYYLRSSLVDMLYAALHSARLARARNPNSLKAAVSNVTSDFDQLAFLLQDFFDRLPDNSTEQLFRDYLSSKADQSHKDFEYFLDWVLSFYNISWPFVVVYALLKLSQRDTDDSGSSGSRGSQKSGSHLHRYSLSGRNHEMREALHICRRKSEGRSEPSSAAVAISTVQ